MPVSVFLLSTWNHPLKCGLSTLSLFGDEINDFNLLSTISHTSENNWTWGGHLTFFSTDTRQSCFSTCIYNDACFSLPWHVQRVECKYGCRFSECSGDKAKPVEPPPTRQEASHLSGLLWVFFGGSVKMSDGPILVRLRRNQSGSQWGFRLQGGYDQGSCLYIQKVSTRSNPWINERRTTLVAFVLKI